MAKVEAETEETAASAQEFHGRADRKEAEVGKDRTLQVSNLGKPFPTRQPTVRSSSTF